MKKFYPCEHDYEELEDHIVGRDQIRCSHEKQFVADEIKEPLGWKAHDQPVPHCDNQMCWPNGLTTVSGGGQPSVFDGYFAFYHPARYYGED